MSRQTVMQKLAEQYRRSQGQYSGSGERQRQQATPPRTHLANGSIHAQDARWEVYRHYGIVEGIPGSLTEQDVKAKLDEVMSSNASNDEKWEAVEALDWLAMNNVEYGMITDVVNKDIPAARNQLYIEREAETKRLTGGE